MNRHVEKGCLMAMVEPTYGPHIVRIGKTTVAKALCNELGVDVYVINGSDEGRFLDTVRNNAKNLLLV